jgi:hypothetical protein
VPVDEAGGARGGRDAEAFLDPHACGLGQCERSSSAEAREGVLTRTVAKEDLQPDSGLRGRGRAG